MTPEQQKEEISKAYLQAVAARCGFTVSSWSQDGGVVDATIKADEPVGGGAFANAMVNIQLKCTSRQDVLHDEFVSWSLEREHYDRLRRRAAVPHLLVVLLLPPQTDQWIEHTPDQIILRRCAWWVRMTEMPADVRDTAHVTVRLPRSQPFSPDQLLGLMGKLSRGESL